MTTTFENKRICESSAHHPAASPSFFTSLDKPHRQTCWYWFSISSELFLLNRRLPCSPPSPYYYCSTYGKTCCFLACCTHQYWDPWQVLGSVNLSYLLCLAARSHCCPSSRRCCHLAVRMCAHPQQRHQQLLRCRIKCWWSHLGK